MPTPIAQPTTDERHLCRLLQAIGFLLISASVFFLVKNVGYGIGDDSFFGFCLLLGMLCCFSTRQSRPRTARRFRFSFPAFRPVSAMRLALGSVA
ncbi:MAG TPA: hypothetical protein VKP65_12420 [Rhodothermales bacterium]|nr:hypothetical protein [Rhodothermales bacterium]